jgi:hypothetical protein
LTHRAPQPGRACSGGSRRQRTHSPRPPQTRAPAAAATTRHLLVPHTEASGRASGHAAGRGPQSTTFIRTAGFSAAAHRWLRHRLRQSLPPPRRSPRARRLRARAQGLSALALWGGICSGGAWRYNSRVGHESGFEICRYAALACCASKKPSRLIAPHDALHG